MKRPRGETAAEAVKLIDGTRTAQQVADIMGVGAAYIHATATRRGVRHLLIIRKPTGVKIRLRAAEAEVARLTAQRATLEQKAYLLGVKRSAETVRSIDATGGLLHQPTLDAAATILEDIIDQLRRMDFGS